MVTTATTLPKKIPNEDVYCDFDFTNLFASSVTINTPTFRVCDPEDPDLDDDDATDALTAGPPQIVGMVASQLVSDGDPAYNENGKYLIEMHVVGSDGSSQSIQLILPVVAKRLG